MGRTAHCGIGLFLHFVERHRRMGGHLCFRLMQQRVFQAFQLFGFATTTHQVHFLEMASRKFLVKRIHPALVNGRIKLHQRTWRIGLPRHDIELRTAGGLFGIHVIPHTGCRQCAFLLEMARITDFRRNRITVGRSIHGRFHSPGFEGRVSGLHHKASYDTMKQNIVVRPRTG